MGFIDCFVLFLFKVDKKRMSEEQSSPAKRSVQADLEIPQIDLNVLNDLEFETQYLVSSLDNMSENMYNLLHSISSIAADNVEIHKTAVNKLTDNMDANIKCIYTIMAKTEELSKSMQATEKIYHKIKAKKRLVDLLDSYI
ncbi:C17orf59 family protein [Megaselia abdita]